ncbi:MAG: valine--tRNA ligase [Balneolales bacterium]
MSEIPKKYDPKAIEDKWYQYWTENEMFRADNQSDKEPFTIMMPPPNVTGALHMGHALQGAVQDTIIRIKRMQGYEALWLPGTDHAGIATQNVVEKSIKKEHKLNRHDLGREKFVEKVWEWKEKYGDIITGQYKKLGTSCDWDRERFTMDEGLSRAVQETFIRLHKEGLIYKGNYLVNWCPTDMTAISDEEVDHVERKGHLWYVKYPLSEATAKKVGNKYITIATTRPETIPADAAVSVNPEDGRYADFIGGQVEIPTTGRLVPIIADDYIKMEFGTGALKVTPAHDQNDFDIGKRHDLEVINIINKDGSLNEAAGAYAGMDRFDARKKIAEDLGEAGLIEKVEDYVNQVGISGRSGTIIEPLLSDQWFVNMKPLAQKAMDSSKNREFQFFPQRWESEFYRWMENIRDWVISRQLWWGHRIPVWYYTRADGSIDTSKEYVVSIEQPEAGMVQDPDVLDTWFSSWLWPFSTLGWPDEDARDYKKFYPTSLLVSGYDILFFWISRMLMGGLHFTDKAPFKDIFMTGIVKDKIGRKMSKSLNNGIDPLELIDQYGADAVRYCLIVLCAQGQDIKLDPRRFEMGRNFANKLWNAFRLLHMHMNENEAYSTELNTDTDNLVDRWMISRIHQTIEAVEDDLSRYRLNEALMKIYALLWDDYCDWYLELIKPEYGETMDRETVERAVNIYEILLKLLHPFMPFITEEIWHSMRKREVSEALIKAEWPVNESRDIYQEDGRLFITVQRMVSSIRNIRAEMNVPDNLEVTMLIKAKDEATAKALNDNRVIFEKLIRLGSLEISTATERPKGSASAVVDGSQVFVPLTGIIDIEKERGRIQAEVKRLTGFLKSINAKLRNEKFMANAPDTVVEKEHKKKADTEINLEKLKTILEEL